MKRFMLRYLIKKGLSKHRLYDFGKTISLHLGLHVFMEMKSGQSKRKMKLVRYIHGIKWEDNIILHKEINQCVSKIKLHVQWFGSLRMIRRLSMGRRK